MSCEENYRDFCGRINHDFRVFLSLGSRNGGDYSFSQETLTNDVEDELRDHIRESLFDPDEGWRCEDAILVGYTPNYTRLRGEIFQLNVADHPRVEQSVSMLPIPDNKGISVQDGEFVSWREPRFRRGLVCYVLPLALEGDEIAYLIGRCSSYMLLQKSLTMQMIFGDGAFDRVERVDKGSVVIDPQFQYILYRGCLYFQRPPGLRRIFRYGPLLKKISKKVVNLLVKTVDIKNSDQLIEDCAKSKMMMKGMAQISKRPYLRTLTTKGLVKAIKTANMGDQMIEHTAKGDIIKYDPSLKGKMLKILDDDFLTSPMTGEVYNAVSKKLIHVPRKTRRNAMRKA